MEEPATTQMKEETATSLRGIDIEALTTLRTFAHTNWRKMVQLAWLAPYQGAAQDKWP
jgi:hypothetical protein